MRKFSTLGITLLCGLFSSGVLAEATSAGQLGFNVLLSPATVTTLIAPSTNVHGIYLRGCGTTFVNGSTGQAGVWILASADVPANPNNDPTARILLSSVTIPGQSNTTTMPYEYYLPVGTGVFGYSGSSKGNVWCTYDVLQ